MMTMKDMKRMKESLRAAHSNSFADALCGTRVLACLAFLLALLMAAQEPRAEGPPLPPGLSGGPEASGPTLPPGLEAGADTESPALPPGLGEAAAEGGPALPPGLAEEEPAEKTAQEGEAEKKAPWRERLPSINGFADLRAGLRLKDDPAQSKTATLGEARLQLEAGKAWKRLEVDVTSDFIGDGVTEELSIDLRQARLTWTVSKNIDLRIGRQVLTWGTGDMLFINDLFPKDWQAFFIGRDVEYLKAPSNSVKAGWYSKPINIELVYTPLFEPDRFITGERISYWNPMFLRMDGSSRQVDYDAPGDWFEDSEYALRIYRSFGKFELSLYGYAGFWKSPAGMRIIPFMEAWSPRLNVYGASVRGMIGKGIVNAEVGYYDSIEDPGGGNLFINNGELRFMAGYERELAKNFTGALQYYHEYMMDYGDYKRALLPWVTSRDEHRALFTVRLTKLLLDQNLTLSLFGYVSPTDGDSYLRPNIQYKLTDRWRLECGGNVFLGASEDTFFGQFHNNTNVYAAARYSF